VIVIPHSAAADALRPFVRDLVLRLYSNDIAPAETDTAARYSEVNGLGYAAITLAESDWTITEGPPAIARSAQKVITFTGAAGWVYGYYLTRAGTGRIAFSERFDKPVQILNNGDRIKVAAAVSFGGKRKP
jgi:hypothetical protein